MSRAGRVGGVVVGVTAVLVAAAWAGPPFAGVNAGAPIWGGTIQFTEALAADIASAGCRTVRVNFRLDNNSSWTPSHLAKYDTIIQTARSHNLQVLGIIAYEAVSGSQAQWNENYNTTGVNPYTQAFADTAFLLMQRYKNDVKWFEIWNEPNCWSVPPESNPLNPGCFYIWPRNYANILAETYKKCIAAGGADFFTANGISLATGGLLAHDIGGSFSTARDYFTSVYAQTAVWNAFQAVAGRRYPWDYFGYHFYVNGGQAVSTSELAAYLGDIRAMKGLRNDTTRFIISEIGWAMPGVSAQLQADNLRDAYNALRAPGDVASVYWYQWRDGDPDANWGLVYSIGNPKPSYDEFAHQCAVGTPPIADFTAEPVSGFAPLSVQFTDLSDGDINSWLWDFGDGHTSGEPNPLHQYLDPGTYTVSLTVTGPGGSDADTRAELIAVHVPPVPGDLDGDRDVDADDFGRFRACLTGARVTEVPAGCGSGPAPGNIADLDGDGDADQADFGVFQRCLSGPGVRGDPRCAD